MSGRSLRARLDRLGQAPAPAGAICRFHGPHCRLGANWPLPYPEDPHDDLRDLIRQAHQKAGRDVGPHPREVWATGRHELVPQAELDQRDRELQGLIAEAEAVNEETLRELRAGVPGVSVYRTRRQRRMQQQEQRDRELFDQIVKEESP